MASPILRHELLLLGLFLVLIFVAPPVTCNCPVHGCSPSCSFSSAAEFVTPTFQPRQLWSWRSGDGPTPSGVGCVTDAARVVCPITGDKHSALISWDTVDDGKTHWNVSLGKKASLPVMDQSGGFIASDGRQLVGYQCDGVPFGKAIQLFPINGHLFDLISVNNKVVLFYKCGFLVAYLTNGIPHASIWLNDTVNGVNGTFIPLNNPAVQGERMYVLAAFNPWNSNSNVQENVYLRLFAISVRDSEIYRIKIEWFHDMILPGVSIPYIHSSETVCSTRPPPGDTDDDFGENVDDADFVGKKFVGLEPIADVAVETDLVIIVFNYYTDSFKGTANESMQSQEHKSNVLVVKDLNTNYSVKYTKKFELPFQSVAVDGSTPNYGNRISKPGDRVWIAFYDSHVNQSVLMSLRIATGAVMSNINVSNLLGAKIAIVTSKMTFLHHQQSSSNANMINPLVFGVLVDGSQSVVIAVDVSTESARVLWSLDQGEHPCVGQISTVDRVRDSLLVVSNTAGVSVYLLTEE